MKPKLKELTAIILLACGIIMAFIALMLPPPGEIHDSVLFIFAQILIYCGSILTLSSSVATRQSIQELKKILGAVHSLLHRFGEYCAKHRPKRYSAKAFLITEDFFHDIATF